MIFDKNNFKQEVEEFNGLALVDFFAPWCGPCQMMAPIVEEMINENKDKNIKIGKLNIDENQDLAVKYKVMSIPSFLVFKNGQAVKQKTGYGGKAELIELIEKSK